MIFDKVLKIFVYTFMFWLLSINVVYAIPTHHQREPMLSIFFLEKNSKLGDQERRYQLIELILLDTNLIIIIIIINLFME